MPNLVALITVVVFGLISILLLPFIIVIAIFNPEKYTVFGDQGPDILEENYEQSRDGNNNRASGQVTK